MTMRDKLMKHRAHCITLDTTVSDLTKKKGDLNTVLLSAKLRLAMFEEPYVLPGGALDLTKMPQEEHNKLMESVISIKADIGQVEKAMREAQAKRPQSFLNPKSTTQVGVCCGERKVYATPVLKQTGFINVDPTENIFQAEERMLLEDKTICIPANDDGEPCEAPDALGVGVYEMA